MSEEHRIRTRHFKLKLYEEEFIILEKKAFDLDVTKTEYLRSMIVLGGIQKPIPYDKEFRNRLLFLLNNIANNVNQIAYNSNAVKCVVKKDVLALQQEYNALLELYASEFMKSEE